MSRFYGELHGRPKRPRTCQGDVTTGLVTYAATWTGAVKVELKARPDSETTDFLVTLVNWPDDGVTRRTLSKGVIA